MGEAGRTLLAVGEGNSADVGEQYSMAATAGDVEGWRQAGVNEDDAVGRADGLADCQLRIC